LAYQRQNKCGQALAYFDQALKLDPNNSLAIKGAAECKSGKPSAATAPPAPSVPLVVPTLTTK
jgi:Tfp pilus assembly protein PilF